MHHIDDLRFKKEIIPLLDSVCSEPSRDQLYQMLTHFPATKTEVLERQQNLRSLSQYISLLPPFSYGRSEFHDCSSYMTELRNRDTFEAGSAITFRFLFTPAARQKDRGRLTLLFIFLDKIRLAWINPLESANLPPALDELLRTMRSMLLELEVRKYQAIGRQRNFTLQELIRCQVRLNEQIRTGRMDAFWRAFHEFEAWLSIARGIHRQQWNFPVFGDEGITIRGCYHPLLVRPIKNDIRITEQVLLLTGPNMSGKSTLLKSIGLCVVMASLGLAVPAASCELPFYEGISIAIDLRDDLLSGYSHFMQELMTLKKVLTTTTEGKRCFAIFDELFRGTNPEDALAISQTTITGLTRFPGSCFLISTHLQALKGILPESSIATHYIECILDNDRPRFTYRLLPGWSDCRIGRLLFEKEGLNTLLLATPAQPITGE